MQINMQGESVTQIFILFTVLSELALYRGYRVKMTFKDFGNTPDVSEFEVVSHDNPPFETESEEHIDLDGKTLYDGERSSGDFGTFPVRTDTELTNRFGTKLNHDGVKISGFLGNVRHKRSLSKLAEGCVRNAEEPGMSNQVVTVEKGETFHLPCHGCSEDKHEMFESLQWLKLEQFPDSKGLYRMKEVVSGLHDDDNLNRIVLTLDHTLIIKKAKMSDGGSYFCKSADMNGIFMNMRLAWNELQEYIAKESHMRFFFHVDVIDLKHADTIDVSAHSKTRPLEPEVLPLLNIEVTTRWHPWTSCSVCNDDGIRKRMGICIVKKHNSSKKISHDYLRNLLNFAKNGIPCQSQFLKEFQEEPWLQRPNQIQIEECSVTCRTKRSKRGFRSVFSRSEIEEKEKQEETDKENAEKEAKKKNVRVGAYFILKCPGISLTKTINWVNGSSLVHIMKVQKFSKNRITMDMFGNLHFKAAVLSDSGIYSCWKGKKMKYKYEVKIKEDRSAEIRKYTIYLCASFICDFVVFVFLSIVKFLQRRVQYRRRTKSRMIEKETGEKSSDVYDSGDNDSDDDNSDDETSSSGATSDSP